MIETRVSVNTGGLAAAHESYRDAVRTGQVNRGARHAAYTPSADLLRRRGRLVLSQMRDRGLAGTRQYRELAQDLVKLEASQRRTA